MKGHRKMNFIVLKAKWLKLFVLFFCVVVVLSFSLSSSEVLASVVFGVKRKIPIYCVENDNKEIAISFDAAWGSDKTEKILNILKENDITATFFLVGMWVDKYPEMTKKIADYGCAIGTHSNTHADFVKLSKEQILLELNQSVDKIEKASGQKVSLFRAPYGSYNNTTLDCAESLGLKTIQWDVDSLDWKGISGATICSNVISKVKSGSIILCHNNADHIVDALPSIISTLKARGFKFVKISDLILKENYKIDNTGKQIRV